MQQTAEAVPKTLLRRVGEPIVATIAAALLAATLHVLVAWFRRDALGGDPWSWTGRDTTWMLAIGYLIALAPVGVLLALGGALRRRGIPSAVLAFVFGSAIAFCVLLLFSRVASSAWMILALGIGARAASWGRNHEHALQRVARTFALTGAIIYLGVGAWDTWGRARRERLAIVGTQASDGAPSVLLIILDTVRASDLGLYGSPRPTTPAIDSLAATAVVFDHAFATAPWTLPSHASMFTGLWPSQHRADWLRALGPEPRTIAEAFRAFRYATGGFTANLLATGVGSGLGRGFVTYRDTKRTLAEIALHSTIAQGSSIQTAIDRLRAGQVGGAVRALLRFEFRPTLTYQVHDRKPASEVTDEFLAWHRKLGGRRFFAFVNYFDAHGPYDSPMANLFDNGRTPRDRHDGAVRYIDTEIARLLASLRSSGELDDCIVVITADHGEQFGEHGLRGHGNSLYLPLLHVPLVIHLPHHAVAGQHVSATVSLRDLAATLAFAAGLHAGSEFPGQSLDPYWSGADHGGRDAIAELSQGVDLQRPNSRNFRGGLTSVFDDSLHAIREDATGTVEAYRYRSDGGEQQNLARSDSGRVAANRRLDEALRREHLIRDRQP